MTSKNPAQQTTHFIGIGGIGMSGIARMYLSMGRAVQGSDLRRSDILSELEILGAKIFIGHDPSHVKEADGVVYSSSIRQDHPERVAAVKKGIPVLHRAEALAEICHGKLTIAVTGTHGKTTTTALVGMILREAGRDPSIVVGGLVSSFGGNAYFGTGPEIVIEADESDSSFLRFSPGIAVITNIEEEHLDHFKTIDCIEKAYQDFLSSLIPGGAWFGCAEDSRILSMAKGSTSATLYGFQKDLASIVATDIMECPQGRRAVSFRVWRDSECLGAVDMKILGRHNVLNALASIGVGLKLDIPFSVITRALGKYDGAERRFDVKYESKDYLVVDDYAHHPTEIKKTLEAAKALGKNRIVALFQPHRYSRTQFLMREFGRSFQNADKLIVTDIYAASEEPRSGISGERLCKEVHRTGHPDATFADRASLAEVARSSLRPGDLVIVMGAGDIFQVAGQLSDYLCQHVLGSGADFAAIRGKVLKNEPMAKHTSLKIGGPAQYWVEPEDAEDLKKALIFARKNDLKISVFGAGSNLLPPDEGFEGMVLHLGSPYFRELWVENGQIISRAGVPNALFIQFAVERGFGGYEFLLGIPGNVGGAIAMNAGSHGQWIGPFVECVTTIQHDGRQCVRKAADIPFAYRHCPIHDEVIVEAVFNFPPLPREGVQKKLDEYHRYRASTQDLRYPSAGCMFKNPGIPGCSSGRLIDEAGLKGLRIGNAQVSEKHANFIVNLGGATSRDMKQLIGRVQETVKQKFNIELETEVRILE
jgi:UDP-N-acetylmuramate--L-alanine ligase/UDP-N-acetylenolpyruvoylglucosamine reductase